MTTKNEWTKIVVTVISISSVFTIVDSQQEKKMTMNIEQNDYTNWGYYVSCRYFSTEVSETTCRLCSTSSATKLMQMI